MPDAGRVAHQPQLFPRRARLQPAERTQDPPLRLNWHGRSILVVHDPAMLDRLDLDDSELVLHGHTHLIREERTSERLIFNPGECAGQMVGYNAIGVVDLTNLDVELLKF